MSGGQSSQPEFVISTSAVEYAAEAEPWSIYVLDNGIKIRARMILSGIEETGEFTPDGYPMFKMNWVPVMDVIYTKEMQEAAAKRRAAGG